MTEDATRRQLITRTLGVAAGVGAVAVLTEACDTSTSTSKGSNMADDAGNINNLQDQEEKLTLVPFNRIKKLPAATYPADLLLDSTEMRNLRERLLRFNTPSKLGYAYLFTANGQLIAFLPVKGKVSSTQSSMTTSTGVYKSYNAGHDGDGGGNVPVEIPSDDLSFGPNEGGQSGKFFFTPDDVMVFWDGPLLYVDAPLKVLESTAVLQYPDGSKPSSTSRV